MRRRISTDAAARAVTLALPDTDFAVTARSMHGSNVVVPADSYEHAAVRARELRTLDNHMVCILARGKRVARWDRINASGGRVYGEHTPVPRDDNRWRRVAVDRGEMIGSIREIWTRFV
ncbi:hypothetical protein PSP6_270085 [Paraburkholderia tropica]|uniref:type IV pilus biogenesis protein PilI n=1 Tax=Paraburkholderia tropica TaxID=92647 RepID=UPI001CACDEA0|nr:hypothetical protein [Paraburkholderia tropica]CAG9207885.1 hypothetical protein PSP6_270085 [Paraburkholderia tropica]